MLIKKLTGIKSIHKFNKINECFLFRMTALGHLW